MSSGSGDSKRPSSPRRNPEPQLSSPRARGRRNEAQPANPDPNYTELMDNLENAEQSLIEHMRTAGMKKTRECQLIDELLNLRKSRRQAFTLLTKDMTNTRECQEEEKHKFKYQLSQMKQTVMDLQSDVEKKEHTLRNIQNEFKKKLEDVHYKYRQVIKDEVNGVSANYEKKLSLLESKIEQVQQVTGKRSKQKDEEEEEKQAQKLQMVLEENNRRQNEKYSASMQRYKDALKALAEKEKRLEDLCQKKSSQLDRLAFENKQQKDYINKLSEKLTVANEKVASIESSRARAEKRLEQVVQRCQQREEEANSVQSITNDAINSIQSRHVHELRLVDEKVRHALQKKDETIFHLQSQLEQIHKENKEAESLLIDLNSNIKSSSSGASKKSNVNRDDHGNNNNYSFPISNDDRR